MFQNRTPTNLSVPTATPKQLPLDSYLLRQFPTPSSLWTSTPIKNDFSMWGVVINYPMVSVKGSPGLVVLE